VQATQCEAAAELGAGHAEHVAQHQRTGVSSSTSTLRGTPLTLILMAIVTSSVSAYSMIGIVYDLRMSSARHDVTIVILLFASGLRHGGLRQRALPHASHLPHSRYVAFSKWRPS
jgi:hypothetical protein